MSFLTNNKVKYIKALSVKKNRATENCYIVEGEKIVTELILTSAQDCVEIFYTPDCEIFSERNFSDTYLITKSEMKRISQLATPSPVLAVVRVKNYDIHKITTNNITLVLDTIQDPGNLGTIIRIADWYGIENIICSHECVDLYNPKLVQSTMGSIFRVKVFYTDIVEWLKNQKQQTIYATTLRGKNINDIEKQKNSIIVIGNESQGISEKIIPLAHHQITIPRKGKADSLNAAVATGIILSHFELI